MQSDEFEWDDAKAEGNLRKHGVAFPEAMSVLADPLALTRFDEAHSAEQDRSGLPWDARRPVSSLWWCIRLSPPPQIRRSCA